VPVAEHVILFGGPMGAGKTTAIQTLSEVDVVLTEAGNSDLESNSKPTTTVALDYGEIALGDEDKVRLYGIPGQRRFDFMWTILRERAQGFVLLVNNDAPDPVRLMLDFVKEFRDLHERGGIVVGVTRTDVVREPLLAEYADALVTAYADLLVPVFTVDARDRGHMRTILMTLVANIEMRAAFAVGNEQDLESA
jgi:signal recognition particle receptor subunit beta